MSLRRKLAAFRRSADPDGTPGKIRSSTRPAAACGIVLAASVVLAGTASAADASPQARASSGTGVGYAVTPATAAGATAAVAPASTPSNSWCQGRGSNYFGWFGVAPGSSADGGVASDLWWDAKDNASPTPVQIYTGNGGANQQWCEEYLGHGAFAFYAYYYKSGAPQCLTVKDGYVNEYEPGLRVYSDDCGQPVTGNPGDQDWYVCSRSGNSVSLQPAEDLSRSAWLDVWGGNSDNGRSAFKPMNPLQIWTGNGQDNQRFTLFPSPGEPNLTYQYTTGVSGC